MALDSDSGAAQRSLDTLANAYGLQCSDIIKNTTWGAGSSIKMSRRKQQKPRQFPTDSDDAGTTENGVSQAVVSGHLAELDTEAVAADHITVRAVSANASVVEEDVDDDACDVSEDLEHLDDLLKQVQRQTSEPEEKNKDIKTMSTTTINGHFEGDIASNGDEQIEEDRASLDQESLDPDEDIDEEELDAMDNEDSEGSNSAEAASRVLAQNVKLNRLQNTNVAVQQIVENNDFGSAPVGWKRLADHIIFLTHQQAIQMLKLDEIWQLILRCSPEDEQRALDTSRERAKHPPRSLSLPRDLNFGASMTEACKMISAYMAHQVATAQFPNISGNTPLTVVKDSTTAPIPSLGVAPSIGSVPSTSSLPHPSEPTKASSDGATKSAPPSGGIQQPKFPFIDPTASLPGLSLPSTPTPRADTDSPSAAPLPGGSSFSMDRSQYAAPDDGLFRHKCRFCHKVLGSDSALQIHIRSHTGEKPFKCNVCGNRFSTKGNLKVHFDRHKQQYPHLEMDDRMYPEDPAEKERANSVMPLPPAPPSPPAMEPIPIAPRPPQPQQTQPVAASQPLIASSANGPPSPPRKVIEIAPKKDEAEEQQPLPPRMPPFPLHGMPPFLPTSMAMTIPMSLPGSMPMPMLSAPNGMGMPPPGMPGLPPGMDPSMFHRPSILPQNNAEDEDDPMEQYMEIQKSETSKLEDMVKGMDDKLTDPNQCAICMRILSCKSALQMHYRTHTGERPFKCKICGRAFTTKGNLKTHMGVHRSKPPLRMMHQCPVCHKQFTNALVLQQHIRTHTGSDVPKMFPDMMNPMMGFPMPFPGHGLPGMPGMPGMPPFPHPGMMPQGMDLSSGRSQDDGDNSNMTGLDDSMDSIDEGEELGNKRDRSYLDKESDRDLDNERPAKQMRKDENESSEKQMPEENIPDKDKSQENQQRDGCERNTNEEPSKVSSEATDKPGQPPMSLPFPFYNHMPPVSSSHNHNPSSAYSSMSLAALQDKVNAISQQNFNQFSPFQQLHAGSFPTMGNGSHADDSENDDDISDGSSNSEDPQSLESQEKSTKNGDETRLDQPVQPISEATTTTNTHSKNSFPGENQENQTSVMNEDIVTPPKSDRSGNSSPSKEKENPVVSNAILMSRIPISSSSSIENMAMSSPIDPYTPRRNKDNRHMCHVCNKPFSSSSALQIHMRTHTGERPFKCEICAKAFTTRGNLKVHMSTHAQQLSPARRGRRMSMEGIPGLTPPKETGDFYPPPGGRLFPGAELFPHGLPFPFPPPNGFFPPGGKPGNAIPVIQSPMFPHGMLQGLAAIKAESNGEKNNNASPDHMAKLVGLPTPELFQQHHNKLAAFAMEKHHEPSTEQGLNLSVK